MDKRLLALYIWLCVETCVNLYLGFVHVPKFFAGEDFVVTRMVNATRNCSLFKTDMTVTRDAEKTVDQYLDALNVSKDCFVDNGEVLWEAAQKELLWDGSKLQKDEDEAMHKPSDVPLSEKLPHMLNGMVLVVCGFVAPSGELLVRVVANIFCLANFEARKPRCYHNFHTVYEILHGPLQHLTQFKLYLCFLQMLLSVNVAGIDVISMKSGPGVEHFVVFVAWSIFLNSVVKRIEKPILKGLPLNPHVLPNPDWIPKLFSKYTGRHANSRLALNVFKLVGFYLFYTLPVFTLIFNFEPVTTEVEGCPELPSDVKSAKYYTDSFLSIRSGFYMISEKKTSWLMLTVLGFQFFICNLISPVFQIVHAIGQEIVESHAPSCCKPLGWYVKNKDLPKTIPMDEDNRYLRLSEQATEKWSTHSSAKKCLALLFQCCAENQAHEYFVCAFSMLVFVLITVLSGLELNHKEMLCGTLSISLCYNPFICAWMLVSIPLLGRARAKLYILDKECSSVVQWTQYFHARTKYKFLLIFWVVTSVAMAYGLVFSNSNVSSYFGQWTMQPTYVIDHESGVPFNCFYYNHEDGRQGRECFSMTNQEGNPVSNRKLIHYVTNELSTLLQEALKSSLFGGGNIAWNGLGSR